MTRPVLSCYYALSVFMLTLVARSITSGFMTAVPKRAVRIITTRTMASTDDNTVPLSGLYLETPLVRSASMSALFPHHNVDVYLKLDCLQRSGSFKDRGMARLCHTLYYRDGCRSLVSSSGGNAGLAVATVAAQLPGLSVHVVVPETTKDIVIARLRGLDATVTVHGANWNAADKRAREMVAASDGAAAYVSPYDDPLLWEGHATLVPEVLRQLPADARLGAVVASVGGGGLLCGVLQGLHDDDTVDDVVVVAAETTGAASFHAAWMVGRPTPLTAIDSVATSLGALEVTGEAVVRGQRHNQSDAQRLLRTSVCTDEEAVRACVAFANDHRMLVEPACGAALASVYSTRLREESLLLDDLSHNVNKEENVAIVIEVCGGSAVNLDLLTMWKKQFDIE